MRSFTDEVGKKRGDLLAKDRQRWAGVHRIRGAVVLDGLKSARSHRTLPLPMLTADALHGHRTRQAAERVRAVGQWAANDLVSCTEFGTPLDPRNLNRSFRALLIRANAEYWSASIKPNGRPSGRRCGLHHLRHSCASFLLALGNSPRVVMELLGHSGIAITMNTYAHVLPTLLGDAGAGMDDLLGGATTG